MFKNSNQNKANLSELVNCAKITPIFIMVFCSWSALFIYVSFTKLIPIKSTAIVALTPLFSSALGLIYGLMISRKRDMSKKENCYSYKGDLTELLIILHKFGFELEQESKNYIQLDLKRLFAKPKSIFLIQDKKEIKILGESSLIEAIAKSLITIQAEPLQHKQQIAL